MRKLRTLHRNVGAVIALFLLMLSVTGIMLNHSTDLQLDRKYLTWNWVLERYGVGNLKPDATYFVGRNTVSQFGSQIMINTQPVAESHDLIVGAIMIDQLLVMVTENSLLLFNKENELVEKITGNVGIPIMIQNIGVFHGDPVMQTRDGMWRSDFMLEAWERISLDGVAWSKRQVMPHKLREELVHYFHRNTITVERVILDLHNGYLFGKLGVWLADLWGLFLIFIALSGLWLWFARLFARLFKKE